MILDDLSLPFVQRGLWMVLLLAIAAGLLGTWIVLRGLAFFSHAVASAAFPGLVLADGLGFAASAGALGTGLLIAAAVAWLRRSRPQAHDSLTALVLVGALATGVILAADVFGSRASVETLLFGSLLALDSSDVLLAAVTVPVVVVASLVAGPRWLATGFDESAARAAGLRSPRTDAVLYALVALVAVAMLSVVGALLAAALLVVPAATTRMLVSRMRAWQLATVALASVEGVGGLLLAVETNAPPGSTIAVVAGAVFAIVAVGRAWVDRRVSVAVAPS